MKPMYVLQVKSGCELTACRELMSKGFKAMAPMRILLIRRGGKWHRYEALVFTSYIFVEFDYSDKAYYDIKSCTGVIRLLGAENKPESMAEHEQMYIRWIWNQGKAIEPSIAYITLDNSVLISSGILIKLKDKIVSYQKRQRRAIVRLNFLGKDYNISLACNFYH